MCASSRNNKSRIENLNWMINQARRPSDQNVFSQVEQMILTPFAERYLAEASERGKIANSCHATANGFYESWKMNRYSVICGFYVTIGNVYFKGENLYKLTKSKLLSILDSGNATNESINVHVWLTWDNMTVVDPTIVSTLLEREKLNPKEVHSKVLIWKQEKPGDYEYEPILVDNDFLSKIDTGLFQFS